MEAMCFYPKIDFTFLGYHVSFIRILSGVFERPIPPHQHGSNHFEFHYVCEGEGWVEIDQRLEPLQLGDFYVTGPNVTHRQVPDMTNPMKEYCMNLVITPLEQAGSDTLDNLKQYTAKQCPEIKAILEQLLTELDKRALFFREACEELLKRLFIILLRNVHSAEQQAPNETPHAQNVSTEAERALLIDEYFLACHPHASLNDLAQKLHLSSRQTQRIIMDMYQRPFMKKLMDGRMAKAKMLLNETDLSITTISAELGFSSLEHFSTSFRKSVGHRPSEFRKQHRP